jgi:hypothetical protein
MLVILALAFPFGPEILAGLIDYQKKSEVASSGSMTTIAMTLGLYGAESEIVASVKKMVGTLCAPI